MQIRLDDKVWRDRSAEFKKWAQLSAAPILRDATIFFRALRREPLLPLQRVLWRE